MPISVNDMVVKEGTAKTLESSGASIANNAMAQADDASYVRSTDGSDAPNGFFVIGATFAVAPTENRTLDVYYRELNVDGTADEQVPEATYKWKYACSFTVNNVTTLQTMKSRLCQDVPREFDAFIHNNDTGQTLAAGWTLKFTPQTVGPKV